MVDPHAAPRERVQLDYLIELYGAEQVVTQPFVVAVLADLGPAQDGRYSNLDLDDRKFLHFDRENLDQRLAAQRPRLQIDAADGGPALTLDFTSMDDFSPLAIAARHAPTQGLLARRTVLAETHGRLLARGDLVAPLRSALRQAEPAPADLLEQLDEYPERAAEQWALLCDEVRNGALAADGDLVAALQTRVLACDHTLGTEVTRVLRQPGFRRLESVWRGLDHLLGQSDEGRSEVTVLTLSRDELEWDLTGEWSFVGRKLHDEFQLLGGHPAGLLVLDFEFTQSARDVAVLAALARLANALDLQVLAGAAPALLGVAEHALAVPRQRLRDLQRLPEYAGWCALRADPAARRLGLVAPRAAARPSHALAGTGPGEFRYTEPPADADTAAWINGAFALAAGVLAVQSRDGWPAALDCAAGPVTLPPLPHWTGIDALGCLRINTPLDADFPDRIGADLAALGLIALQRRPGTTDALLASAPMLHAGRPARAAATTVALAPASPSLDPRTTLAANLALDQLARWLRCWRRDWVGAGSDPDEIARQAIEALLARFCDEAGGAQRETDSDTDGHADTPATPRPQPPWQVDWRLRHPRSGPAPLAMAELLAWQHDPWADPPQRRITVWLQPAYGFAGQVPPAVLTLIAPLPG